MKKLYVSNFLTGFVLWYGIEKLFMHTIHITNFGIAVNAIVFVVVSLVLNIPCGVLADKWNRKYTLMLGISALGLSTFILGQSKDLSLYLIGTVVYALYVALSSGTYQAITYDLLAESGNEREYVKYQGRSYGVFLIGVSVSSVLGGYIAHAYGYRAAYFLTILPCVIGLFVMWTIHEPKFHKEIEDTKLWLHIKRTASLITRERLLFYLCLLFVAASLLLNAQNEYGGLYFIALGFGAIGNGWGNAGKWFFGSTGQFMAQKLSRYTRTLIPIFFLTFLAFTLFRSPFGVIFFYAAAFMQATVSTNIENVIQNNTPSSIRATMLSVLEFASSSLLVPMSLLFGLIARHNVFNAYLFVATIGFVFLAIWYLRPRSTKSHKLYVEEHPVSSESSVIGA